MIWYTDLRFFCLIILRKEIVCPVGDATKLFVSQQNVRFKVIPVVQI